MGLSRVTYSIFHESPSWSSKNRRISRLATRTLGAVVRRSSVSPALGLLLHRYT